MLNYDTLLSSYDDKLTLMQWLKKVEEALKGASAVSFKVNKKGDATLTFSVVFEDGSEIESGEIVLQQGESVQAAAIRNGHLILTLTNGDELDAGQLLNGDLNVSGNLAVTGKITGGEIVENMTGYSYERQDGDIAYAGCVKNGNKITFALFGSLTTGETLPSPGVYGLGIFRFPASVGVKLIPNANKVIYEGTQGLIKGRYSAPVNGIFALSKDNDAQFHVVLMATGLAVSSTYSFRLELTFLLSDNLAA